MNLLLPDCEKVGHCHDCACAGNPIYSNELTFIKQQLGISMIINPEHAAATEISRICASVSDQDRSICQRER